MKYPPAPNNSSFISEYDEERIDNRRKMYDFVIYKDVCCMFVIVTVIVVILIFLF